MDDAIRHMSESTINQMVNMLFSALQNQEVPQDFSYLLVDMRWAEGTDISKVRAVLNDGQVIALLDTPLENLPLDVGDLFYEIRKLMQRQDGNKWYGLKLYILQDGSSRREFDQNPDCAADPSFWDD